MPAGDEARIIVTFDTKQARTAMDELARHGQSAFQGMGGGPGQGWRGGGGAMGAPGGASGGARSNAPAQQAGGGAAVPASQGAAQASGIGLRGVGAAAAAVMAAPGLGDVARAGIAGFYGGASDATAQSQTGVRALVERLAVGDLGARGRGFKAAMAETEQAFGYLAGDPNYDLAGAQSFFDTIRAHREREEKGRLRLQRELSDPAEGMREFSNTPLGLGLGMGAKAAEMLITVLDKLERAVGGMNK